MDVSRIHDLGARARINLENAHELVDEALNEEKASDEAYDEFDNSYQKALDLYGEAFGRLHQASEELDEEDFDYSREVIDEAVESVMDSKQMKTHAFSSSQNMVDVALRNTVNSGNGHQDERGFPQPGSRNKAKQARENIYTVSDLYETAVEALEQEISEYSDQTYQELFGLKAPEEAVTSE